MRKGSEKRKQKRSLAAGFLAVLLFSTTMLPIHAMCEIEKTEEAETEEMDENIDDIQIITEEESKPEETEEIFDDIQVITEEESQQEETEVILEPETFDSELSEEDSEEEKEWMNTNEAVMLTDMSVMSATTAPDVVGEINTGNEWQIVSEKYSEREQADKQGYDIDQDGVKDIYYQKNVIPTGVENEFRVYMGITKVMTWDELLAECTLGLTTQGKWKENDVGSLVDTSSIGGNKTHYLVPGKGNRNYYATIYLQKNGKTIHTYTGWYNGTTPNASNCTGYIILNGLDKSIIASIKVNLHNDDNGSGGTLEYTIDLDKMVNNNIYFSVETISADSVQDTMGDYITCEGIEYCDGTANYTDDELTWTPASNGVSGVQVNGSSLTGYYYNVHQLVYKVHLKAEQEGFNSCAQNMDSSINDKESYPVNRQAILNCSMKNGAAGATEFQVPYVRGLLYDLEIQKIVKDSKVPVSGISFSVERKAGGSTIAEKFAKTDTQVTQEDGWLKFHNLPWGTYTLKELTGADGSFQKDYLSDPDSNGYEINIGKVINESALSKDHGSGHSVDQVSDVNNMLVQYNGNSIFENTPNTAKITIKKMVSKYEDLTEDLKGQKYTIRADSVGEKDIYLKPGATDTALNKLDNQESVLKHEDTVSYDLIVSESGGIISLEEIIPEEIKDKVIFGTATVTQNNGSAETVAVTQIGQGCEVTVKPGDDLTITITNEPVLEGTLTIQKVIDNYRSELSGDAFLIRAKSMGDNGATVNTEVVLKHGESSGMIKVEQETTIEISEVLPKEYFTSSITISGGGKINGSQVAVKPGENVTVTVHNTYAGKSYFHVADAVTNLFRG